MTKLQNRQIAMYGALCKFCKENPALVLLSPAFQKSALWLEGQVARISIAVKGQTTDRKGRKSGKDAVRGSIAAIGGTVSGLVAGWANEHGDPELEARNQWTEAKLEKLPDNQLPETCSVILDDGNTALAGGAENGLSEELLLSLKAGIGLFREGKDNPRKGTTERSTQTKMLEKLIAQTGDHVKKRMDKNALFYKVPHPEFYIEYRETRKLVDPATRSATAPGGGA